MRDLIDNVKSLTIRHISCVLFGDIIYVTNINKTTLLWQIPL